MGLPLGALVSTDIEPTPTPTVTTTIFITTTFPTSFAPSHSSQSSLSDVKAIIAGATVGGFLGCVAISLLLWWFCLRNKTHASHPTQRAPVQPGGTIVPAAPETLEKRSSLSFGFLSRSTKGGTERSSNPLPPGPRSFLGEHEVASRSFAPSFDGTNPPIGIPMVQPSFANNSTSSSPRSRIVEKLKRVSGGADLRSVLKPAPNQYGVLGSI